MNDNLDQNANNTPAPLKSAGGRTTIFKLISTRRRLARAYNRGSEIADYPPVFLWVEPTNHCNLRCPMCPHSDGLKRPQGFMPLDRFSRIISQAHGLIQVCSLHFAGESLLHKDLPEMIRMVAERGIPTVIHSNGAMLTPELSRKIINSGLRQIVFSFDAVPPEDYEKKRPPAKFDTTLQRIRSFLEEKKRLKSKFPLVTIKSLMFYEPGARAAVPQEMKNLFHGLPVDHFAVEWAHTFAGSFAGKVLRDKPYGFLSREKNKKCILPWYGYSVGWDGNAFACCNDLNGEYSLGNLDEQSITGVWNGPQMRALRRNIASGKLDALTLCADCDALWRSFTTANILREAAGYAVKYIIK